MPPHTRARTFTPPHTRTHTHTHAHTRVRARAHTLTGTLLRQLEAGYAAAFCDGNLQMAKAALLMRQENPALQT